MSVVDKLLRTLREGGVLSAEIENSASVALAIGDVARNQDKLTRRYIVSYDGAPRLSVKLLPGGWGFDVADIVRIYAEYAHFPSFRVPRLVGQFPNDAGVLVAEEYLPGARTLAQMVAEGSLAADDAAAVLRQILEDIWGSGRKASPAFLRQEKERYREHLRRFVGGDLLAEVTADYLDRIVDRHRSSLRRVLSAGDILDKNVVRSQGSWYLVDFEYAHETAFFFKEAFRSILNSEWATALGIGDLCSFLGEFPEAPARLLSLAWEGNLYAHVLDHRAEELARQSLKYRFWHVFDAGLAQAGEERIAEARRAAAEREDAARRKLAESEEAARRTLAESEEAARRTLAESEEAARRLQATIDAHLETVEERSQQVARLEAENRILAEAGRHASAMEAEVVRLQMNQRDVQLHVHNLEAELGRLREAESRLEDARVRARNLEAELGGTKIALESAQLREHRLGADVDDLQTHQRNVQLHVHNLEAELGRLREAESRLEDVRVRARNLEAELGGANLALESAHQREHHLQAEIDDLQTHRQSVQLHVQNLEAELVRLRDAEARVEEARAQARELDAELGAARLSAAQAHEREDRLAAEIDRLQAQQGNVAAELRSLEVAAGLLREAHDQVTRHEAELEEALERRRVEIAELEEALERRRVEQAELLERERAAQLEKGELQAALERAEGERQERERVLDAVLRSRSWRLTHRFRRFGELLRRLSGRGAAGTVSGAGEASAKPLLFNVEVLEVAPSSPGSCRITVQGWCFAPHRREPVQLELRSGERTVHAMRCESPRDDVASGHAEHLAATSLPQCGFHDEIVVDDVAGQLDLISPEFGTVLASLPVAASASGPGEAAPPPLRYHLEQFRILSQPFGGSAILEVSGWCWAPWSSDPVALELLGDGRTLLEWRCDLERADVAEAYGSEPPTISSLPFCGFGEVLDLRECRSAQFHLVTADRHLTLAEGSFEDLQRAGLAPSELPADIADEGLGGFLRRLRRQARAKINRRTMFSARKWRQWSQRAAAEFRLYRLESRLMRPAAASIGARAGEPREAPTPIPFDLQALGGRVLKVACFTHNLNLEGATKVLLDVAIGLRRGASIEPIVVSPFDGPARARVEAAGVRCDILPLPGTLNLLAGWRRAADYRASVDRVGEFLASEKPDVVVAMVLNNFFVIEAAERAGIPSLWLIQESLDREGMIRSVNPFAVRSCEQAFLRARQVVFGSQETCDLYRYYDRAGNFRVIHNALPAEEIEAARRGDRGEARARLGLGPEDKVVVSVGTVCLRKDQATVARALGSLGSRRNDVHGYLVGARAGDHYVKMVQRAIDGFGAADRIHLVEEVHDVSLYYRAADIFAFASLNECFPLVILEAMAHGLPIVTTQCTGVSEQVHFGRNAVSFDFGDAEGLARELERLLDDATARESMGVQSREILAGMLDHEQMIRQYAGLVMSAWQGRNRAAA